MKTAFVRQMAAIGGVALVAAALAGSGLGHAAGAPSKKPAKVQRKSTPPAPPAASAEQLAAAQLVFYGDYRCELDQSIHVAIHPLYGGYADVKHGKATYLMKPVLSSTGAIRLEDVKGETLMVQIAAKSMLMNVKAGRRLVDECVSPQQRELIEAAARARAAEAAASAASAADSGDAASAPAR